MNSIFASTMRGFHVCMGSSQIKVCCVVSSGKQIIFIYYDAYKEKLIVVFWMFVRANSRLIMSCVWTSAWCWDRWQLIVEKPTVSLMIRSGAQEQATLIVTIASSTHVKCFHRYTIHTHENKWRIVKKLIVIRSIVNQRARVSSWMSIIAYRL